MLGRNRFADSNPYQAKEAAGCRVLPGSAVSGSILQIDEVQVRGHVDAVVRRSVEETLNGLLDAEADQLCRAQRYERPPDRVDTRAGSYELKLQTKGGEVKLARAS